MKTYFISGHRDATKEEFKEHYEYILDILVNTDANFVVGDCNGVDKFAIDYLKRKNVNNVTVYHIGDNPMNNNEHKTLGGFSNDIHRDYSMTLASDYDLCWVRQGKERSGTQQNIDRRKWYKNQKRKGRAYGFDELLIREAENFI